MAEYWPHYTYYKTNEICRKTVFARIAIIRKQLAELRMKGDELSHSEAKEITESGQIQSQADGEYPFESVPILREKLDEKQAEISLLRDENQKLRSLLENINPGNLPTRDGLGTDDLGVETRHAKSDSELNNLDSSTNPNGNQQDGKRVEEAAKEEAIYRLQLKLHESEDSCRKAQNRADHMTYLLNQKLIELNKLQLTLSGQTKEMIQLEKAYFQLKCHLNKGYQSSTPFSRNSSRVDLSNT